MMRYLYRPQDPRADSHGMLESQYCYQEETDGAPYIISDDMAPTRHMADNRMYTSKAKFRRATKDAGCIEVGNETATMLKPRAPQKLDRGQRVQAIRNAIEQLRARS